MTDHFCVGAEDHELVSLRKDSAILKEEATAIEDRTDKLDDTITEATLWAGLGGGVLAVATALTTGAASTGLGIVAGSLITVFTAGQIIWHRKKRQLRKRAKQYRLLAELYEREAMDREMALLEGEIQKPGAEP